MITPSPGVVRYEPRSGDGHCLAGDSPHPVTHERHHHLRVRRSAIDLTVEPIQYSDA
jgi:hypothetical protein